MDQNAKVWGDLVPGPSGTATVLGNAEVTGTTTSSPTKVEMPAIDLPSIPSSGDLTVPKSGSLSVGSGDTHFDTFVISSGATVEVEGPATLIFESFEIGSGAEFVVDATNGEVEIYVVGDFVMNSNTLIASIQERYSTLFRRKKTLAYPQNVRCIYPQLLHRPD